MFSRVSGKSLQTRSPMVLQMSWGSAKYVLNTEIERGGPCWLLKLRWMGTLRVQTIGVLPWLVRCTHRAGTIDFCPSLATLVSTVQNITSLTIHIFTLLSRPHRPETWAGRRAGSPVSVSPVLNYVSRSYRNPPGILRDFDRLKVWRHYATLFTIYYFNIHS